MIGYGVIGLLTLGLIACPRHHLRIVVPTACADGLPIRLIEDVACPPDGICGFTCAPHRWADTPHR